MNMNNKFTIDSRIYSIIELNEESNIMIIKNGNKCDISKGRSRDIYIVVYFLILVSFNKKD